MQKPENLVKDTTTGCNDPTEAGDSVFGFIGALEQRGQLENGQTGRTLKDYKKEILSHIYKSEFYSNQNNEAAKWRFRRQKRFAVEARLKGLGKLALLQANLLTTVQSGTVVTPKYYTYAKQTLTESPLYMSMPNLERHGLVLLEYEEYERLEDGLLAFGQMLCLASQDLDDLDLCKSFSDFKVKAVTRSVWPIGKQNASRQIDYTLKYIKWLSKACQAVFLQSHVEIPNDVMYDIDGNILPFSGKMKWVSDMIKSGTRGALSSRQARALSQLANCSRALPYPSLEQSQESIEKTIQIVSTKVTPSKEALKEYRTGLHITTNRLGLPSKRQSHVSLVAKGSVESSRSQGGRAAFLVAHARTRAMVPFDEKHLNLVGRYDQFGNVILNGNVVQMVKAMAIAEQRDLAKLRLGDLLFVEDTEVIDVFNSVYHDGNYVPKKLAHILNLTASTLILQIGEFNINPEIIHGFVTFKFTQNLRFKVTKEIHVKADVSLESGMKTRLITAGLAAFQHLSQIPSNLTRDWLSTDPFCRVGFEESEKLWEVLKAYEKKSKT